jgi:hypothetical protein
MGIHTEPKSTPQEYVEEIIALIRERFPDAELVVHHAGPKEYRIDVFADFESGFDVLRVTSERVTDILTDTGIYVGVSPVGSKTTAA